MNEHGIPKVLFINSLDSNQEIILKVNEPISSTKIAGTYDDFVAV